MASPGQARGRPCTTSGTQAHRQTPAGMPGLEPSRGRWCTCTRRCNLRAALQCGWYCDPQVPRKRLRHKEAKAALPRPPCSRPWCPSSPGLGSAPLRPGLPSSWKARTVLLGSGLCTEHPLPRMPSPAHLPSDNVTQVLITTCRR